jgi:ubiquinol-cytochrome c reductase cytochrome b subunit
MMARFGTLYYFGYFLLVLPFSHKFDKTKPVPERVTS